MKAAEKDSTITQEELNKMKVEIKKKSKEIEKVTSTNYQVDKSIKSIICATSLYILYYVPNFIVFQKLMYE